MPDENAMEKAEREIAENLPEGMKGVDTEDVGDVGTRRNRSAATDAEKAGEMDARGATKR